MIATTEETLDEMFVAAIVAMDPRRQYKGAERWKPYDRKVSGPARTRAFRLIWGTPRLRRGGAIFGSIFEHEAELRVRTDYVGTHDKVQFVINDDLLQLRDTLSTLKANDNGLELVEAVRHDRRGYNEDEDTVQIDHVLLVRYMRSITP